MKSTKPALNPLASLTDKALEAELAARKLRKNTPPWPLDDPDWGKLKVYVAERVEALAKPDSYVKNFKHELFEEVLETVYGKDIWDWWNQGPGNRG